MGNESVVTRFEVAEVLGVAPTQLDSLVVELSLAEPGKPKMLFTYTELKRLRHAVSIQTLSRKKPGNSNGEVSKP